MVAVLLTILITYLITTLFGHILHWILHQEWSGFLNRAHKKHHFLLYPVSDFTSAVYRQAGSDSTPKFFFVGGLPLIILPIILWYFGVISLSIMLAALITEGVIGFLHDYLHDAFHITNHWLHTVPILGKFFSRWFALHFQHHLHTNKNFGIFTFHWDRVLGSFKN
jgi:hypothetical protein